MFLLDTAALPDALGAEDRWRRRTHHGLRLLFWTLWVVWLGRLYEFAVGGVLPLFAAKLKQQGLADAAAMARPVVIGLGLGFVLGAVLLARPPAGPLRAHEGRLLIGLRLAMVPLWGAWWGLSAALWAADRSGYEVSRLLDVGADVLFTAAAIVTLGYLARLAFALGQRKLGTVATIMAVYAMLPLELETVAYPLFGHADWKSWLPILSAGRLAAWVVTFGGALLVTGRLRRLMAVRLQDHRRHADAAAVDQQLDRRAG